LTAVLHELHDLWWELLSAKEREKIVGLRVRGTGRGSVSPPALAPFDFGINEQWWAEYHEKPEYKNYLMDWYSHGDPEGFGNCRPQEGDGDGMAQGD
jgi:hypothetical protein